VLKHGSQAASHTLEESYVFDGLTLGGTTMRRSSLGIKTIFIVLGLVLLAIPLISAVDKLIEAAPDEAKKFAVAFDFDKDSCYPAAAISKEGEINGGLKPTGGITGECRDKKQLENSNTYYRKGSIKKDGVDYAVHMYALYFPKDQFISNTPIEAGHRHDWEYALVWTKNGEVTHASVSAHGGIATEEKGRLHFDEGKPNTVKVVYHKDDVKTHAFRFAKEDEKGDQSAENDLKRWVTPDLVDWHSMNGELRRKLNEKDFGDANCPVNDNHFANEIAKKPPAGYPSAEDWKAAAKAK
jgi:hypothetical protein